MVPPSLPLLLDAAVAALASRRENTLQRDAKIQGEVGFDIVVWLTAPCSRIQRCRRQCGGGAGGAVQGEIDPTASAAGLPFSLHQAARRIFAGSTSGGEQRVRMRRIGRRTYRHGF